MPVIARGVLATRQSLLSVSVTKLAVSSSNLHLKGAGLDQQAKHLQVTCAIIERDALVLTAQRSAVMSHPGKWEFPGGKIVQGESPAECLRREIREELGLEVSTGHQLASHTHHYPALTVTLHPFVCTIIGGEPFLHEHAASIWLPPAALSFLDWAEADLPLLAAHLAGVVTGR